MQPSSALRNNNREPVSLPAVAAIYANARQVWMLTPDGELQTLSADRASTFMHKQAAIVCHAPYTRQKSGVETLIAFDVLELFAFVHPAKFCAPTPTSLCKILGLEIPAHPEDYPLSITEIARALLDDIRNDPWRAKADPAHIARVMGLNGKGWVWAPYILEALNEKYDPKEPIVSKTGLNIWRHLPEWAEESPPPPPSHFGVSADETRERLLKLMDSNAENRAAQFEYAAGIAGAFAPKGEDAAPHIVIAEAGTGIGKTLGYLAPASVWSEKNNGAVWISTFTKNLQRQIDQELTRLYPDKTLKETYVAIRKGRENYMCLLNFEETAASAGLAKNPGQVIAAGIMARWAAASRDGDLSGGDFPAWLTGILGYAHTVGLADRRGECIYSACDHYQKCFIEKSVRKSKHARIVIANHALVMIQAALSGPGDDLPGRVIFDEGHHLFDAADSAFAAHLTARETRDLRRWILGAEGARRTRARGLKRRAETLTEDDDKAEKTLNHILYEAQFLAAEGWQKRIKDSAPSGPAEEFLFAAYKQVMARADGRDGPYSLETQTFPMIDGMAEKAMKLQSALKKLQKPMQELAVIFRKKIAADTEGHLASDTRKRLESVAASLDRRAIMTLGAWIHMLESLKAPPPEALRASSLPPLGGGSGWGGKDSWGGEFIDWLEIERIDGRAMDVGMYRHYIDPMKPFASSIAPHIHGMAVTSATLRDDNKNWDMAIRRSGANYLTNAPQTIDFESPFDYPAQTKIFIINDVRKDDMAQVASAFQALFKSSGGGALGIFTAIGRLKSVHTKIAAGMEDSDILLYAQHVDEMDPGTLVDIFREDINACLLGTDAVRDGVDVPGEALRMIVFDRVPWPRPTILHKARREAFGRKEYDDMIARLKLKQAFGRLIRKKDDRGVFVMLDPMLPSRLLDAFPEGTEIKKCGLSEAVSNIREFMSVKN